MARAKEASDGVRLTHANGATVVVSDDKAERLIAGGQFTEQAKRSTAAKPADSDK
jgi:hypothetical protein